MQILRDNKSIVPLEAKPLTLGSMHAQSLRHVSATPWSVAHQAPLSVEFSRQEYWSGLPFPSPGYLLNPGIEPASSALAGRFFTTEGVGKPTLGSTYS